MRGFYAPNLHVGVGDFRETVPRHGDDFLFVDPPYIDIDTTHKYADTLDLSLQEELADLLNRRGRWLLTINDVDDANRLYRDRRRYVVSWRYTLRHNQHGIGVGSELAVLADDVPAPTWAEASRKE